jgi:hypothetical protein
MPNIYDTLNQALKKLERKESEFDFPRGNPQDPWEWVLFNRTPLQQLRYILTQNQHSEQSLKDALRAFLKNRYQNKHNFTQEPLDLLYIQIAEEIAEKDEPILSLLLPQLDKKAKYTVDYYDEITLSEMTEYQDLRTKNRRLKDLTQFIVSENNKRIIACIPCCQSALTTGKFTDATYFPVATTPELTQGEQIYLARWDSISQECIKDWKTNNTINVSQENPITVTHDFFNRFENEPKNTLFYEFNLLIECLLNGGVTRTKVKNSRGYLDHDRMPHEIAGMGIARFKKVWFSLPGNSWFSFKKSIRDKLGEKKYGLYGEDLLLGACLFRLFLSEQLNERLTYKETGLFEMAKQEPYIKYSCVDAMASNILIPFSSSLERVLKNIIISPPSQPIITPRENNQTITNEISKRLKVKYLAANPMGTVNTLEAFFMQMEQSRNYIQFCDRHIYQLSYIIRNDLDLEALKNKLVRNEQWVISLPLIYYILFKIYSCQEIDKFKSCCSLKMLEYLIKTQRDSESSDELTLNHVKAIIDDKQKIGENKSTLYIACENNCKAAVGYLLKKSKTVDSDLRSSDSSISASPLSHAASSNPELFTFIVDKFYPGKKLNELWDSTINDYIKSKRPADKCILDKLLEIKNTELLITFLPSNSNIAQVSIYSLIRGDEWFFSYLSRKNTLLRDKDISNKTEKTTILINYITFCPLSELITLSKLMMHIQNTGDQSSNIVLDGKTYDCTLLHFLRKERNYFGHGNTNSWQQVMTALQEQIKLRFQAGLINTDNNDKKACVQALTFYSDRLPWHLSNNNQEWIDENLEVSATNVSLRN